MSTTSQYTTYWGQSSKTIVQMECPYDHDPLSLTCSACDVPSQKKVSDMTNNLGSPSIQKQLKESSDNKPRSGKIVQKTRDKKPSRILPKLRSATSTTSHSTSGNKTRTDINVSSGTPVKVHSPAVRSLAAKNYLKKQSSGVTNKLCTRYPAHSTSDTDSDQKHSIRSSSSSATTLKLRAPARSGITIRIHSPVFCRVKNGVRNSQYCTACLALAELKKQATAEALSP